MNRKRARLKIIEKSEPDDCGCWNWTACIQSNGYGRVTFGRVSMGAHRLSYLAFKGDIDIGMDICHSCDNRSCVNPDHLFQGTRKQNMEDCVKKGRQAKGDMLPNRRGELSHFSKLNSDQVVKIRDLRIDGVSVAELAKTFCVSTDNIRRILRRDTWKHI